jgi:hypothetical protein
MALTDTYRRQVALLIRILPTIVEEEVFALKGAGLRLTCSCATCPAFR